MMSGSAYRQIEKSFPKRPGVDRTRKEAKEKKVAGMRRLFCG